MYSIALTSFPLLLQVERQKQLDEVVGAKRLEDRIGEHMPAPFTDSFEEHCNVCAGLAAPRCC